MNFSAGNGVNESVHLVLPINSVLFCVCALLEFRWWFPPCRVEHRKTFVKSFSAACEQGTSSE